jgi:hypothetical protein
MEFSVFPALHHIKKQALKHSHTHIHTPGLHGFGARVERQLPHLKAHCGGKLQENNDNMPLL